MSAGFELDLGAMASPMDMQDTVARLKQGIATMADEVKLQDLSLCSLQEPRVQSAAAPCTKCGKRAVLRETADGAFWGCSAFPRCFSSRPLKRDDWKSLESAH